MSSPENSEPVISPFSDVQENVRRFNEDEAVWRCFEDKRALRKDNRALRSTRRAILAHRKQLDDLDWLAAEREARPVRAIGTWIAP